MNPAVLVVSEDPQLIHHAFSTLRPYGMKVVGCLGPARGPCKLETDGTCPLALHCSVVLVDSPNSGSFRFHEKAVPVADYAAELAQCHPDTFPSSAEPPRVCPAQPEKPQLQRARPLWWRSFDRSPSPQQRQMLPTHVTAERKERGHEGHDLHPRSIIDISKEDSLREAARHLADDDIGALAIFDATGPAGVLSERDLARAVADEADLDETPVEDYMTDAPIRLAQRVVSETP